MINETALTVTQSFRIVTSDILRPLIAITGSNNLTQVKEKLEKLENACRIISVSIRVILNYINPESYL